MDISRLDHLVLTVENIHRSVVFYTEVLGMVEEVYGEGRVALNFGTQKINLHQKNKEHEPKAAKVTPGSADLCFLTETPLGVVISHLEDKGVEILASNVERTGAVGPILSVYFRDPDGNLLEVSNQISYTRKL